MKPSSIVSFLLEDDQEDPKAFIQRTPRLRLDAYFTGTDAEGKSYRTTSTDEGYFTVSINKKDDITPYVGLSWETQHGCRGGFGQVFVLKSDRDVAVFLVDLAGVEKAVTVDGNAPLARSITDRMETRTQYSRPNGYSVARRS